MMCGSMVDNNSDVNDRAVKAMISHLLAIDQIGALESLKKECSDEPAHLCIDKILVPSLQFIGDGWEKGEVSLSQVYMSGKIAESIIDTVLEGHSLIEDRRPDVAVAVLEDHHTLGKKILTSLLKTRGYAVKDYGHGLTVDQLVQKTLDDEIPILMISTLMLNAALKTKEVIHSIKKVKPHIRIIVGGAPYHFDHQLWKEVGADAWGRTATDSLLIMDKMISEVIS